MVAYDSTDMNCGMQTVLRLQIRPRSFTHYHNCLKYKKFFNGFSSPIDAAVIRATQNSKLDNNMLKSSSMGTTLLGVIAVVPVSARVSGKGPQGSGCDAVVDHVRRAGQGVISPSNCTVTRRRAGSERCRFRGVGFLLPDRCTIRDPFARITVG
ncbi:MAG: hypothetical protein ACRDTC_25310 [Pseudonocardiaceae bacterium]